MLTDPQIDRYSRQIILPEIGGRGQERLLAARLALIAQARDLTPALDYLVGAGVGTIELAVDGLRETPEELRTRMRGLSPDARLEFVRPGDLPGRPCLVLAASEQTLAQARRVDVRCGPGALIVARLDSPGLIAALDAPPPCLACAHPGLLAPFAADSRPEAAVAMAAVGEAIRHLAGIEPAAPRLIEFRGYGTSVSGLAGAAGCPICRQAG